MTQDNNPHVATRQAKLDSLIEQGIAPYPNTFKPKQTLAWVAQQYKGQHDADTLASVSVICAGRVMLLRNFGKLTFLNLRDESGQQQVAVQRDEVGADLYRTVFRKIEVGDLLGVTGALFRTKTGELTIRAQTFQLQAKSLRPLPEKWHGLEDVETRYRQRYLDLIVNPDSRRLFHIRSQTIRTIRHFMENQGFLEVETPMMHPIPGGAIARPFVTHHNALNRDLFLRIAPELYLKRLIVGGFEKVFEINRNFRNEGLSIRHNPEFTTMEFYQAYATYHDLMALTETLLVHVVQEVHGTLSIPQGEHIIDFSPPWPRLTLAEALVQYAGADRHQINETAYLLAWGNQQGIALDALETTQPHGLLLLQLFEALVESRLLNPTFIVDYPIEVSPLSRRSDQNPDIAERFELFIGGWEIANAFSELNDPADQAERFHQQVAAKESGDTEAMHFDDDYIRALEYGMPPTAGEGIGIDRLVMLLTNAPAIRDVLLFPQLRSRQGV